MSPIVMITTRKSADWNHLLLIVSQTGNRACCGNTELVLLLFNSVLYSLNGDVSSLQGTKIDPRTSSYHTPPLLSDCREAFELLPSGTTPTWWYTEPTAGEQENVLPLIVRHG